MRHVALVILAAVLLTVGAPPAAAVLPALGSSVPVAHDSGGVAHDAGGGDDGGDGGGGGEGGGGDGGGSDPGGDQVARPGDLGMPGWVMLVLAIGAFGGTLAVAIRHFRR